MQKKDIPNIISVLRILLTIPVIWALLEQQFLLALVLFFIAGVSDGLDGFLAKHYHWQSRLGGLLDPLADKALLVSSFLCLGGLGLLPSWLVALVILRDVVIVSGALIYTIQIEELNAQPSLVSKLNTLLQILLVLLVVVAQGVYPLPAIITQSMIWAVTITTVLSGIDYVIDWSRRAARHQRKD
ncbi:MAG: CDP-alcohol phosphatidyltransferase family protein [Chromatiales bacterium]|jgi:cardiolipin synthase